MRWRLGWVPVERAWESGRRFCKCGGGEREWRDSPRRLLLIMPLMMLLLRIQ